MNRQSGQALVEWGLSAFVLMLFAFGLLAVGHDLGCQPKVLLSLHDGERMAQTL